MSDKFFEAPEIEPDKASMAERGYNWQVPRDTHPPPQPAPVQKGKPAMATAVPAERDYSGQIEKLMGTRHKLVSLGASSTELYEIDASLAALREAAAASYARYRERERTR